MRPLAERLELFTPSSTLALNARAKALKASGRDIVNFGIGEPDFDTPFSICEAAIRAISEGFTRYTPVDGIGELKEAICKKFKTDNGLNYNSDQIVVSNGGKHSLFNIFLALFQSGDEVIVPVPTWVSYPPMLLLAGAQPILVPTRAEDGYTLSPEKMEASLTSRTRGLIINSPSNPTGMVYGPDRLKELAELAARHDLWVISDDIYEKIIFDGVQFKNIPMLRPELIENTVIVNGFSKTYAMTGWRLGYMAGPTRVARAVAKIQSQSTSNPCSISQKAGVVALTGSQEEVTSMVASFVRRRELVLKLLADIPGLTCLRPQGAFYVFPNVSAYLGKKNGAQILTTTDELATYLLEAAGTAIVPGTGFGDDQTVRLSYAVSEADIERGLIRVKDALLKLI